MNINVNYEEYATCNITSIFNTTLIHKMSLVTIKSGAWGSVVVKALRY
jgi:hypothetical protein